MKIALLGDTHFGVRNGSRSFNEYFEKFYANVFFPYLLNNNIRTVVQFGDIMDNRRVTHIQGLSECKRYFFDKLREYEIELITLIGNHDSFFKDSIKVNSPKLLLGEYDNINLIEEPKTISIGEHEICFIPWICKDNYESAMQEIERTKSEICFGHLELQDFPMHKGILAEEGMDHNVFDKFSFVGSGHYHHRSNRGNIYYLGTPYELTWNDFSDSKGFYVFDLSSRDLEFVNNPYKMFQKIYYDDLVNVENISEVLNSNALTEYSKSYIKLIVKNKNDPYLYDMFIDALYKIEPIDLTIIEDAPDVLNEELQDIDETEDTVTILSKYVDAMKIKDLDINRLKTVLTTLYEEAVSLDIL